MTGLVVLRSAGAEWDGLQVTNYVSQPVRNEDTNEEDHPRGSLPRDRGHCAHLRGAGAVGVPRDPRDGGADRHARALRHSRSGGCLAHGDHGTGRGGAPITATTSTTTPGLPVPQPGALTSYTAQIAYKQEVVQPAPTSVVSWISMTVRYQGGPSPAYALDVTDMLSDPSKPDRTMKMIDVGQDTYLWTADESGKWLKTTSAGGGASAATSNLLDPNELAKDAPSGTFTVTNVVSMTEQVGGETTTHYRATGQLLGGLIAKENPGDQVISGQADFWISNNGNYIKQYQLDALVQDNEARKLHEAGSLFVSGAGSVAQIATPAPSEIAGASLFDQPAQQAPEQTVVPGGGRTSEAGGAALEGAAHASPGQAPGRCRRPGRRPRRAANLSGGRRAERPLHQLLEGRRHRGVLRDSGQAAGLERGDGADRQHAGAAHLAHVQQRQPRSSDRRLARHQQRQERGAGAGARLTASFAGRTDTGHPVGVPGVTATVAEIGTYVPLAHARGSIMMITL